MFTVNVAVPVSSADDSMNCPWRAFGSEATAIGETMVPDSASNDR